jgi:surface protein
MRSVQSFLTSFGSSGSMFQGAASFNQNISHFDVSRVTDMSKRVNNCGMLVICSVEASMSANVPFLTFVDIAGSMLRGCNAFNQSLAGWNTSSVTSMSK